MSHIRHILILMLAIGVLFIASGIVMGGQEKADVCHITGTYDFGDGPVPVGHVITIDESAYTKHINHGDPDLFMTVLLDNQKVVCTHKDLVYTGEERVIFVTSSEYFGNLYIEALDLGLTLDPNCQSGEEGACSADAICQMHAEANDSIVPKGTYKAWISAAWSEVFAAKDRLVHSDAPYVMLDSDGNIYTVANNWEDFTDGNHEPTPFTEKGVFTDDNDLAWTGTYYDGSVVYYYNCGGWWIGGEGNGLIGCYTEYGYDWSDCSNDECGAEYRLICIQQ